MNKQGSATTPPAVVGEPGPRSGEVVEDQHQWMAERHRCQGAAAGHEIGATSQSGTFKESVGQRAPGDSRRGGLSQSKSIALSSYGYLADARPEWRWQPGLAG